MPRLLLILFVILPAAGCANNKATTSAPLGPNDDPYFDCRASAAFVRRHIDVCSGILK
jgi:hypothetical protein